MQQISFFTSSEPVWTWLLTLQNNEWEQSVLITGTLRLIRKVIEDFLKVVHIIFDE